jgi:hypothetical protein
VQDITATKLERPVGICPRCSALARSFDRIGGKCARPLPSGIKCSGVIRSALASSEWSQCESCDATGLAEMIVRARNVVAKDGSTSGNTGAWRIYRKQPVRQRGNGAIGYAEAITADAQQRRTSVLSKGARDAEDKRQTCQNACDHVDCCARCWARCGAISTALLRRGQL